MHIFVFVCICVYVWSVWLFATLWAIAPQSLWSLGFSWQEYWSGLPFPSPRDLPDPGIEPTSPASPALAGGFFITKPPGKPCACSENIFFTAVTSNFKTVAVNVGTREQGWRDEPEQGTHTPAGLGGWRMEQSGSKTGGRRCPGKPSEERQRFKWFLWQEMTYSWGGPVQHFRVKSVTIKEKTWGSLKGHVAPSEACSSQWLSHKPECFFLPLCRVTLWRSPSKEFPEAWSWAQ